EIDFAVLDDGVVPVGDIDRAVGAHFHVDGPECRVVGLDQFRHLATRVAGAVGGDNEAAYAMAAEIVGDHVALPVVGQVPAADDFQAAMLRAAGVEAGQHARRAGSGRVVGAGHQVVDALAVGAVGGE